MSKIKASGEALLPGSHTAKFCCLLTERKQLSGVSIIRTLIPFLRALLS